MQQVGQPTHRPLCGARELCPGNCSLLQPPQRGAGLARDFGHPPFACLTGLSVLIPGVFAPLTAYLSISKGGTKRGLVFPNNPAP